MGYTSIGLKELRRALLDSPSDDTRMIERRDGSSILRVNDDQHLQEINNSIRLGHVLNFQALSSSSSGETEADRSLQFISPVIVTVAMSNFLGLEHFNQRYFPFNPELAEQVKDCDFYFTVENQDTQASPIVAGRLVSSAIWGPSASGVSSGKNGTSMSTAPAPNTAQTQTTFIVGPTMSGVAPILATLGAVAGSAITGGMPISTFAGTASATDLEDILRYPYFGRLIPLDYGEQTALCMYLHSLGVSHFGALYSQGPYGSGQIARLRQAASDLGMTIQEQSFQIGIDKELSKAVGSLKQSGLKYFVGLFAVGSILDVLPELYDQYLIGGGNGEYVWTFTAATRSSLALTQTQGQIDGMSWDDRTKMAKALNGTAMVDFSANLPSLNVLQDELRDYFTNDTLLADYESMFQDNDRPNFTSSWDQALARTTLSLLSYDVGTAVGLAACQAQNDFFNGPELFDSFKQVAFNGSSGYVAFDPTTGTRNTSPFPIGVFNVQSRIHRNNTTISYVESESTFITMSPTIIIEQLYPFRFPDGSTKAPKQFMMIDEEQNLIGTGATGFILTITIGIALFALVAGLWTLRNREVSKVKARQPFFLVLICTGTFVMACSSLPITFQDSMAHFSDDTLSAFCMIRPWLFSLGFVLAFSALFAKSRRVYQLFKSSKRFRRVTVTYQEVLLPFFIMATLDVILLVAWTVISPLKWERVIVSMDSFGRVTESYAVCKSEHSLAFALPIVVILVTALMVSNVQSFQARKLPDAFQESSSLLLTNFILLECLFLGLPVLVVVANNPTASAVIQSSIVLVLCLAILLPYFPYLMTAKGNERKRQVSMSSDFNLDLDLGPSNDGINSRPFDPTRSFQSNDLLGRSSRLGSRSARLNDDGSNLPVASSAAFNWKE